MKKIILGLLLLIGLVGWGQEDSLEYTNPREVADIVYGLLDQKLYNNVLFDRSLSEDSLLIQQLKGDYSGVANGWSWIQAYSDIAISYIDTSEMMATSTLIDSLSNLISAYDKMDTTERVYHPFGVLLHQVSKIDSNLYQKEGIFTNQNNQLKLNPLIDESHIYTKIILKQTALLELYGEHGYETGVIVYDPKFISVGSNVRLHSIKIDVGDGFQDFSTVNSEIEYSIYKDWQIGKTIIDYTIDRIRRQDTLSFYLTSEIYKYNNNQRAVYRWDDKNIKFPRKNNDLKYAIRYGCGNGNKIRRPVIIAPPYRPAIQSVSFRKYYDQFDFKSLISSLSEMGYDVIFIKQTPGNRGIDHSGDILADFLKHINQEKKINFPYEDWENIVIGFSAGGQHWRWALKKLEKEHMDWGTPHHHTRLYIPFDSPHWGANVPMFAQAVYYDFNSTVNIIAAIIYSTLKDPASRSMLINHITGSNIQESGSDRIIYPAPDILRQNVVNRLNNSFNHQFTSTNDLRKTFPSFTRNVAVSVGHNSQNYNHEFGLYPGRNLFSQEAFIPDIFGPRIINRKIYSSRYASDATVFSRKDKLLAGGFIPLWRNRYYKTRWAYEWDMAQGGYKNEFYDGFVTSPVSILRSSVFFSGFTPGQKHYDNHMSFMPMVSALAINPNIWQNNNLYYNVKEEGLMYNEFDYHPVNDISNTFGYPNLGHPNDHFNITPFEAVYVDLFTAEHIKMQKSAGNHVTNNTYLVHTRNFILDEVEADIVYLQNKVIGKNHIQWKPYRYKAWYKAYSQIIFGDSVTPKTNIGPYIIEETGEITAYACNSVTLKPGFHAKAGSKFHAFIHCDGCSRPREQGMKTNNDDSENQVGEKRVISNETNISPTKNKQKPVLKVYPNPSDNGFTIEFPEAIGEYMISNTNGKLIEENKVLTKTTFIQLPKGIYFIKWINKGEVQTQKIIAL